ncbi:MAG: class I SAM-dependent methyltransferase [Methanobacterium paludis]|nr:class I SAM-dependent methyltransferase [Methanobacterium paludis]
MEKKIMDYKWSKIIDNYWTKVFLPSYLRFKYYKLFNSFKMFFKFQGKDYKYFYHWYNTTWDNERAIEIPLIYEFVNENQNGNILEIGNVLSHYFDINHDVVDKYEKAKGVINQDVVDFHPSKKYDLIISISTLEHVGWDEYPREPKKIFHALKNLDDCLAINGKLVVTLPIGQNPLLDTFLETGEVKFTENYYLKRISKENKWIELTSGFCRAKYDQPFTGANIIFLGIYYKSEDSED